MISSLNLLFNNVTHSSTLLSNLIIRFSIIKSFAIYYFNAIPRRLIQRFSRIIAIFLITARFLTRFTNKYILRK